ncbi:MAG TPA: EAL domain-containing protein [Spirochaetota bacterium]|nr:EAL domain-containing protein [Spirochaetota bacterium]
MHRTENVIDIRGILDRGDIVSFFQPIISVKKKSVLGFEALGRGVAETGADLVPPQALFEAAEKKNLTTDLDRLCRAKAFEGFGAFNNDPDRYILSVNLDPSILDEGTVGSNHLRELARSLGMQPGKVLIEIIESKIRNIEALEKFVALYRGYGFLIALDDIGTGLSNLDRISIIKPDILKIDKSLVQSAAGQYHSGEIVKSLVALAHRIGSLVIAEGVETMDEAVIALELGVDMLQGYYFAKPGPQMETLMDGIDEKIDTVAASFKEGTVRRITAKKFRHRSYNQIINTLISELSRISEEEYDATLAALIRPHPELECAYILDEDGIQASDTIFTGISGSASKGFFFQPGKRGTDQSSKDYYFLLAAGLAKYTTAPYISLASRNICITVSVAFRDVNFRKRILCLDIIQDNGITA